VANPEGWPINSQGEMMSAKQSKFPLIKTAQVADLIPYARNSRTHSENSSSEINFFSLPGCQNRAIFVKRKLPGFFSQLAFIKQSGMGHIVVIRAKGHKVGNFICAASLFRNDMMHSSDYRKPTHDAFTAIPHSGSIFTCSVHGFWNAGDSAAVRFFRARSGAKALSAAFQHGWRNKHHFSANFTRMVGAIVKRMACASLFAPKLITAICRTVCARLNIWPRFKLFFAVLAAMNIRGFSAPLVVVAGNKSFPDICYQAATAFTKGIIHE
jgi:hypothetical protein